MEEAALPLLRGVTEWETLFSLHHRAEQMPWGPPLPRPQHGRSRGNPEQASRLPEAAGHLDGDRPASAGRGPPRGDAAGPPAAGPPRSAAGNWSP